MTTYVCSKVHPSPSELVSSAGSDQTFISLETDGSTVFKMNGGRDNPVRAKLSPDASSQSFSEIRGFPDEEGAVRLRRDRAKVA